MNEYSCYLKIFLFIIFLFCVGLILILFNPWHLIFTFIVILLCVVLICLDYADCDEPETVQIELNSVLSNENNLEESQHTIPTITYNTAEILKVENINDIDKNHNDICPICLDEIDPINSYKLYFCKFHIFHKECLISYKNKNYNICPLCNV